MSERISIIHKVDKYLRREDTRLAGGLRRIAPEQGLAYRTSRKKKVIEGVIAGTAAVVTAPVVGALAVAIKLEDGGSVFYRSERIGKDGVVFDLLKLRSLREGADQDAAANAINETTAGVATDPRSTRVGAWMRKTRLDELPQLWQIPGGPMALVGMRASSELTFQVMKEWDAKLAEKHYKQYIPARPAALNLMTAFSKNGGSMNERYHYNDLYDQKANLGLDLYVLFRNLTRPFIK